jgi:outer membrane autotransporter protein
LISRVEGGKLKKRIKLFLFSGLAGGCGLLNPMNAQADCSPGVATGVSITCDGTINTPQNFTNASGITTTIIANTQVAVSEKNTPALFFDTSASRLESQGSIITDAITSDGVALENLNDFTLINADSIGTTGSNSNALHLSGVFDSTITNSGKLSTAGNISAGILLDANIGNNTLNNSGVITTAGAQSHGIWISGESKDITINNSGNISAAGPSGSGIFIDTATTKAADVAVINSVSGVIYSETDDGINFSRSSTGTIDNSGVIEAADSGISLQDNAQVLSIINDGIIVAGRGGITFDDTSGTNLLLNRGVIGSVEGDAVRVSETSSVTNGINNEGFIIGRVDAPTTNMSNSGLFDLLNNNSPSRVGNFSQSSDAFLALQAENTANYGQLQVGGTASLAGKTVVVTNGSSDFTNGDLLSDVVSASNIVGTPTSVIDDSLRFQFVQEHTPTSYSLRIIDTGLSTVQTAVSNQTTSPVVSRVGGTIDQIIAKTTTPSTNPGTGPGTNPGTDPGTNPGTDPGTNPGTDPGTNPGTDPGTNPGTDPGTNPGDGNGATVQSSASGYCSGALGATICAITSASNAQQIYRNVVQLGPLMNGMLPYAELNNARAFGNIVESRQDSVRAFGQYDEFNPEKYLWIRPVGRWDNQEQRDGLDGYKSDTRGIAMGADVPVLEQVRVGVAVGTSRTDVKDTSDDLRHDAQIESWNTLLYGSFDFTPATSLTWKVGYGRDKVDGNRYLSIVNPSSTDLAFGGVARSSYDSHNLQAGLGLQSTFDLADKWTLTPMVRGDYFRIKDKGYTEKNASDLGLEADGQTLEAMIVSTKAKLGLQLSNIVTVHATAGLGYDTINDRSANKIAFIGSPDTPLTYESMEQSPWIGMAGVGVTAKFTDQLDGTVQYDAEQRSDFFSQSVAVKVRYAF